MTLFSRLLLFLCLLSGTLTLMADDEGEVINDLGWGEALYYHFRGDKLEALTRLSARMKQGALENHQARAELLTAGILLDYGLPHVAAEKLASISLTQFDPVIGAKMTLANARVFYQQQDYQAAEATLNVIDSQYLDERELIQAGFMQAQIEFDTGRYAQSAQTLASLSDASNLSLYAKYNQGLSLLQLDDQSSQAAAVQLLEQVAAIEIFDQEQYALADQAKLGLAMWAINQEQFARAQAILESIRLDGLVSNEALLLLGWSYAGQEQYPAALTYWQQVAGHEDILSPVVQEAWLATPYAWQQQGDKMSALAGYERALQIQTVAMEQLATLKLTPLWRQLLTAQKTIQPFKESPALYRELVSDPAFYELKSQWQELNDLLEHLDKQADLLPVLKTAVEENRDRFFNKSNEAQNILSELDLIGIQSQSDNFESSLNEQKNSDIALALMEPERLSIWQRIIRSEDTLELMTDANEQAQKAQQLQRLKGVAKWQFHRDRRQLEWQAESTQQQLNKAISELLSQYNSLKQITDEAKAPIEIDANVLVQMTEQNTQLRSEVNDIKAQLEVAMAGVYQDFIGQRELALNNLGEQAILAIARLNFELATGKNSDE